MHSSQLNSSYKDMTDPLKATHQPMHNKNGYVASSQEFFPDSSGHILSKKSSIEQTKSAKTKRREFNSESTS